MMNDVARVAHAINWLHKSIDCISALLIIGWLIKFFLWEKFQVGSKFIKILWKNPQIFKPSKFTQGLWTTRECNKFLSKKSQFFHLQKRASFAPHYEILIISLARTRHIVEHESQKWGFAWCDNILWERVP